jgi:hypothetical protein
MDAFGHVFGFVTVAGAAVDGGGMFSMRIAFDFDVTTSAAQAAVNAGLLLRSIHLHTVARLVLQAVLAVAGEALNILLRANS